MRRQSTANTFIFDFSRYLYNTSIRLRKTFRVETLLILQSTWPKLELLVSCRARRRHSVNYPLKLRPFRNRKPLRSMPASNDITLKTKLAQTRGDDWDYPAGQDAMRAPFVQVGIGQMNATGVVVGACHAHTMVHSSQTVVQRLCSCLIAHKARILQVYLDTHEPIHSCSYIRCASRTARLQVEPAGQKTMSALLISTVPPGEVPCGSF